MCSVDGSTGLLQSIRAGVCEFTVHLAEDLNFLAVDVTVHRDVTAVAPTPPLNVTATPEGVSLIVSWDAPLSDGGTDISGYTATASNGNDTYTCTSSAQQRTCVLNPVAAGKTYNINVVAEARNGTLTSAASSSIERTVDAGVLTPQIITPPTSSPIVFGQSISDSKLTGGLADVPGQFALENGTSQPQAGKHTATVTFTPADSITYRSVTFEIDLQVNKVVSSLTFDQDTVSAWAFGSNHAARATASAGDANVTYSVAERSAEICAIDSKTGVLTALKVGACEIEAKMLASTNFEEARAQAVLTVNAAPPGPPTDVAVSTKKQTAHVSWKAPDFVGGGSISGYRVTVRVGDESIIREVGSGSTECDITGLKADSDLTVSVVALSENGSLNSNASAVASGKTEAEPTPEPTPETTATPEPIPTADPTATPEPTPTPEVTPEPTSAPEPTDEATTQGASHSDPRPYSPINPVEDDPAGVAEKTVSAITLVSAVSAAGAAVAAAAGAASAGAAAAGASGAASAGAGSASGGAAGSGGSSSSSSSSGGSTTRTSGGSGTRADSKGGSGESTDRKSSDSAEEAAHLRHLSRGGIDDMVDFSASGRWGDQLMLWALPLMVVLDTPPKRIAQNFARVLPLGSKIFSDGSYLRAIFGSFWSLFGVVAIGAGIVGTIQAEGMLVLPSVVVVSVIALIGVFDIFAGFLGAVTLAIGLALTAGLWTAGDVRFIFGILALGVVPRVIAGAFRTLKRDAESTTSYIWERAVDFIVAPMLAAWATLQIVDMIPILAGLELPVEELASTLPVAIAVAMVGRILLEEIAGRFFPSRVAHVQPDALPSPPIFQVLVSTMLRAVTFAFIAAALIGTTWHLYVGAALFVLPNLLGFFQSKYPNSPLLFHLLPKGLLNLAVSLWLGGITLLIITGILGETPELAQIGFVILPLPTLALSLLKLFGRRGKHGANRFFESPSMVWFYRVGTLVAIYLAAELTHTISTTSLF